MFAVVLSSVVMLGAVVTQAAGGVTLHTVKELNDFTDDTTRRFTPFCITGTVQSVSNDGDAHFMIISDESGWTEMRNFSDHLPGPGEKLAVTGRAHMSTHQEFDLAATEVVSVGIGTVASPIETELGSIDDEKHHLHPIAVEGTVIDVFPDEIDPRYQFLILKDSENILPVAVKGKPELGSDIDHLRDARIKVTGQFRRIGSGSRRFSGPFISVESRGQLSVIDPALDNPVAAPPLENFSYRTPREIARTGKRSIRGETLAVWGGNRLMLRSADGRIANLTLAHGRPLPHPGDAITAAGYPETDLFRVNLTRAIVLIDSRAAAETQTETEITNVGTVFGTRGRTASIDPQSHGRLMRIRGTVQSIPTSGDSGRRILLASGPYTLPVDLGGFPDAAADLAIGSEVEVTGRCLLEIDSWNPDDIIPRIRSLVAVIRTPEDIRVLSTPTWWTPLRLLVVISVLLAALIGIYIWNRTLQKLVNRRGRELYREQVAHAIAEFKTGERTRLAVELHDSLSQELAGVAYQVAASGKTLDKNPEVARRCIETADKMLNSCRTELRECLFDLRSDTLDEPDFSTAIRKTLAQIESDATVTVRFNVPRQRLKDTTAHAILSIVRELTGNAIRHGKATEIKVAGAIEPERILFSVRDNGAGFDSANCNGPAQGHFGLEGIRNRLEKLDGTFTIDSKPGEGTKATVIIPLPK